jgi:hypothetical protein
MAPAPAGEPEDPDGFERLYVWVRDDELRAGTFDGAWAVCR